MRKASSLKCTNLGLTVFIRVAIFIAYLLFCICFIYPSSKYFDIFVLNLLLTSISLWLGPLPVIRSENRRIFDPKTILNSAFFYYSFKGFSLAFAEYPKYLNNIPENVINQSYKFVVLLVFLGILSWNAGYHISLKRSFYKGSISSHKNSLSKVGILLLSLIAILSTLMFFRTLNFNVLSLLLNPHARAFMSEGSVGLGSSYAFIWYYGSTLLTVVSVVWLSSQGFHGDKFPRWTWIFFTFLCVVLLLITSPRSAVVTFILSIFIVYHLSIKKVNTTLFLLLSGLVLFYSYVINIWRSVTGRILNPSIGIGYYLMAEQVNMVEFIQKMLFGTDLSDIRVFVFIEQVYGNILPYKNGETFLRVFTQFIPRFLWNEKPYDLGLEISRLIDPWAVSGIPPGFFPEMYMNFSFFGVIFGGFLLGVLSGLLYKWWILQGFSAKNLACYSIVAPRLFLIPSASAANVITTLFILLLGATIAFSFDALAIYKRSKQ